MKFRTVILLAVTILVAAIVIPTLGAVALVLDRAAERDVANDLTRSQRVFTDLQAYRTSLFQTNSRVVAEEPRVKATVSSDSSRETVLGVARDLKRAVQSDVFVLTDASGRLIADVADPAAKDFDMSGNPVIKAALDSGEGAGIWTVEGKHAYQVQSRRMSFGTTVVGVIAIGYEIDSRVAETVYQQTGSAIAILLDGKPIASSSGESTIDPSLLALAIKDRGLESPSEIALGGGRWLALAGKFPGHEGKAELRYVMLRSIDRALEARRRVLSLLLAIAGLGLLAAIALGFVLSGRLSKPIDGLAELARAVGHGQLEARVKESGPVELRHLGETMNRMVGELAESRRTLAAQERLRREMEIATRIQTSILPRDLSVAGVEIAARMTPAEDVGGDYYDVLPLEGGARGAWIGVGDVAGHGLTAGLVMLMIQSAVSALVKSRPDGNPRDLLIALNAILFDNIRERLTQDEHVTLTLLRLEANGSVRFAGAHEELVVWRKATGACERVATPGTWLGAVPDIARFTTENHLTMAPGDVLLLYTDGLIQAMNTDGEQFGMERLEAELATSALVPVADIVGRLFTALGDFTRERADDVTVLALRYLGRPGDQEGSR